jgi:hypothetical protein
MEPMTRIELVTSPLPRGCSTAKLHGHGKRIIERFWLYSLDLHVFFTSFCLTGNLPYSLKSREDARKTGATMAMVWAELDSNQRRLAPANLQSASFSHSDIRPYEPVMGFEPATDGLQNRCSTTELHRHEAERRTASSEGEMIQISFNPCQTRAGSRRQ